MKKKSLVIVLSLTIAFSLLAFPVTVGINAFLLPSVYEDTFLGELKYKIRRLQNTDGKRIVLIGGSAIPFGVQSNLIKESISGYDVVDFGMYASLGSNVMLDFARSRINKDDIVLFMPEQHSQTLSMYYDGMSLWQGFDGSFQDIWLLKNETRQRLYGDIFAFSQSKFKYTFQEKIDLDESIYRRSSFNEYGDIKTELTPYNTMFDLYDPTTTVSFSENVIATDFIAYVNEFAKFVRSKEAQIYYYFPPINSLAIEDKNLVDSYYDYLAEQLDFDILGNPYDSIMDPEWFYDSNFHLNGSGGVHFTKKLIQNIKLANNDTSSTNIPLPGKPVIPETEITDGNNTHEDYFTYEENEETCVITDIKEIHESMIVPFRHNGKKVVSFKAETFAGKAGIKRIFIQDNIRYLYDYSFKDCSSLQRIYLQNKKPASINIGAHLLDGTRANIYVSKSCYSDYVTNYNFSRYGERIRPY